MKGVIFEPLSFYVVNSKRANLDLIEPFDQLIALLEEQNQLWIRNSNSKTSKSIVVCKTTLEICRSFIIEDEWKAAFLTLQRQSGLIALLKASFYRQKEQQKIGVQLYKLCLKNMQILFSRHPTE